MIHVLRDDIMQKGKQQLCDIVFHCPFSLFFFSLTLFVFVSYKKKLKNEKSNHAKSQICDVNNIVTDRIDERLIGNTIHYALFCVYPNIKKKSIDIL